MIKQVGEGKSGWVIQHGQTIRSGNVSGDPRYTCTFTDMLSGLYVPMKVGENTIGCISVESHEPNVFDESDEQLLITLADQAALAINNARLYEEIQHRLHQIQALRDIDKVINASIDLRLTLTIFLEQVVGQLGADAADVLLYNPHMQVLEYADGRGFLSGFWVLPGPWLEPGFRQKGYQVLAQRCDIMVDLIDRFNAVLEGIPAHPGLGHVRYIDLRGTLSNELAGSRYKQSWANELHPTAGGYRVVAAKFHAAISPLPIP